MNSSARELFDWSESIKLIHKENELQQKFEEKYVFKRKIIFEKYKEKELLYVNSFVPFMNSGIY